MDSKLKSVVKRIVENEKELEKAFYNNPEGLLIYKDIIKESKNAEEVWQAITKKDFKNKDLNYELLAYLVKEKFIDIRMFGSCLCCCQASQKAYTGPIQLNLGLFI